MRTRAIDGFISFLSPDPVSPCNPSWKMKVFLEEFFTKNKYGEIFLGMRQEDVSRILGPPGGWHDKRRPYIEDDIWVYGRDGTDFIAEVQINFYDSLVGDIMCLSSQPKLYGLADASYEEIRCLRGFRNWLRCSRVAYTEATNWLGDVLVKSPTGAAARFNKFQQKSQDDWQLYGVRISATEHKHPWK